jgi:hypothetical protein
VRAILLALAIMLSSRVAFGQNVVQPDAALRSSRGRKPPTFPSYELIERPNRSRK